MNIIGIGIDYSNICKEYNTTYLDRDNTDRETAKCMKTVLTWVKAFLSEVSEHFSFTVYNLSAEAAVGVDVVASKRFLFFSLEKGITEQCFVLEKAHTPYDTLSAWAAKGSDGLLIRNDEDGEGIYLYLEADSQLHRWISMRLADFSVDEVPLLA